LTPLFAIRSPPRVLLALLAGSLAGYLFTAVGPAVWALLAVPVTVAAWLQPAAALAAYCLAFPFLPDDVLVWGGLALVIVWLAAVVARRERWVVPWPVPMVIFGLAVLVSFVTSVDPTGSFRDLVLHCTGMGLFTVAANVLRRGRNAAWFCLAVSLAAALVGAHGIYQVASGAPIESGWVDRVHNPWLVARAYSVFGNPNVLAAYLLMVLPLAATAGWISSGGWRVLLGICWICAMLCLVLTFSRGAWVAMAASGLALSVLLERKLLPWLLVVCLLALLISPSARALRQRVHTMFTLQDSSTRYRVTVWRESLRMLSDYWMSGVGLGYQSFRRVYPAYMLDRTKDPYHAHSLYLELAVELGLFGLLAFLWFCGDLGLRLLRKLKGAGRRHRGMLAAAVAFLVAVACYGIVENVLYMPKITLSFWIFCGYAAATVSRRTEKARG